MAGEFTASWGPGPIDGGEPERMRLSTAEQVEIVDSAVRSGRVHPRNRDRWLCEVAAGGTRGGTAITTLLQMWPAGEEVRASWPGDNSAADNSDEAQAEVYERLYPSNELAAAVYEFRLAERGRDAARFSNWQHRHDNTLSAASPDGQRLYASLFGGGR